MHTTHCLVQVTSHSITLTKENGLFVLFIIPWILQHGLILTNLYYRNKLQAQLAKQ